LAGKGGSIVKTRYSWLAVIVLLTVAVGSAYGQDGLNVIQSPTFWIVDQWTRIMVETPADCGELQVEYPEQLTLLDRWPYKTGDTVQRFYFLSEAPFRDRPQINYRTTTGVLRYFEHNA